MSYSEALERGALIKERIATLRVANPTWTNLKLCSISIQQLTAEEAI